MGLIPLGIQVAAWSGPAKSDAASGTKKDLTVFSNNKQGAEAFHLVNIPSKPSESSSSGRKLVTEKMVTQVQQELEQAKEKEAMNVDTPETTDISLDVAAASVGKPRRKRKKNN